MVDFDYNWWIDQQISNQKTGAVTSQRLLHYGPYPTEYAAEQKIAELRKTERYRKAELVATKQSKPAARR